MTSAVNKRTYPRYPVALEAVAISPRGTSVDCTIHDFCAGGMFVTPHPHNGHDVPWNHGDSIIINFPAASTEAADDFRVFGHVARVADTSLGIAFEQLDGSALQYLMERAKSASDKAAKEQPRSPHLADSAALAASCREKTERLLEGLVDRFISQAVTSLDQSDELSKRNWRGIIETQQKLHSGRQRLLSCYSNAVFEGFDHKGKQIKPNAGMAQSNELSLIEDHDFQNWLTITALVSKLESHNEETLFGLEPRLGVVLHRQVNRQSNPLGAHVLVQQFQECFDALALEEDMKSVVFRAFENVALTEIGIFYQQLDKFLKENGILPELKKDFRLVRQPGAARRPAPARPQPPSEGDEHPPESDVGTPYAPAHHGGAAPSSSAGAVGSGRPAPAAYPSDGGASIPDASPEGGSAANVGAPAQTTFPGGAAPASAAGLAQGSYTAGAPTLATGGSAPASRTATNEATTQPATGIQQGAMMPQGMAGASMVAGDDYVVPTPYAAANELLQLERTAIQARGGASSRSSAPSAAAAAKGKGAATTAAVAHYSSQELNNGLAQLRQQGVRVNHLRQQGSNLSTRLAEVLATQSGGSDKQLPVEMHDKLDVTESLLSSIQSDPIADAKLKDWFEEIELPFVQVALNNEQVLQDRSHPIHHLFNTLDQLFQMLPPEKSELRKQLSQKVETALEGLDEANGDTKALDEAVNSLDKLYGEQSSEYKRRVDAVIEQCRNEPNARQQTLDMLQDIDKLFDESGKRMIPKVILQLMDAGWKNLLWRYFQREGIEGESYRSSRATIAQLLARLFGHPAKGPKSDWPNSKLIEEVSKVLERLNKEDARALDLVAELITALEQAKEDPSKIERIKKGSMAQMLLAAWEQEKAAAKPVELSKVEWSRWLDRARTMEDSELISFKGDKEESFQQKLVWSDHKWGRYVFVDREGNKGLDLRQEAMAAAMSKGRLLILEGWDRPLMDRATYTMLQSIQDRLIEQTNHDALTGLLNRRGFESALDELLAKARNSGSNNVLCYLDLDRFNVVNVTCGHEAGDELVGNVAAIIRKAVGDDTVVARLGGDEFALILESCDRNQALKRASDIRRAITDFRFTCENKDFAVDASFGLAEVQPQHDSVRSLLTAVDSACFAAKEGGRGRIEFYDSGNETIKKRQGVMEWVGRINTLFDKGLIQLKCQRITSLKHASERPRYEILLQVKNEQGEQVSLDQFVLSAEIYNRIGDIDRWVVNKVFAWMKDNRASLNKIHSLSVNLSGRTIEDEEFMNSLVERLEQAEVPSGQLCFEVTETAAMTDLDRANYFMRRLHQTGVQLALDDFGSGHASYNYLKALPVDYVKIDGSFVRNIGTNIFDYSVVKSIHEMARALGKRTIAEYVESEIALNKIRKIGIDYGQGFIIEKPKPLDDLLKGLA